MADTGMLVEMWKDCHYIAALDATVVAEWYFSGMTTTNSH